MHVQNVEIKAQADSKVKSKSVETEDIDCPKCGSQMVKRINKTTNAEFYGCKNFLKCWASKKTENSRLKI